MQIDTTWWLVYAGFAGAAVGSFLNVLILRLPQDESIVSPRSRCPGCLHPIAWYDNIPILSWLLLRGRCRRCKERISVQYPLIELTTALLWVGSVWHYEVTLAALAAAVFGTMLLGIAVTDLRHYLIPDEYTLGGLPIGVVLSLRNGVDGLTQSIIGAAVGFGLLYAVAVVGERLFKKEAMGGGDIKMMAMVGSFVGWKGVLLTIFGGSLLGTLVFAPLLLFKIKRLVPFGVFLAAAAAITFVFGDQLIGWYVGWVMGG